MGEHGFTLVAEVEPAYCPSAKLFKWVSQRTGLQVVLIQRQSPSVSGFFTVATEANDNSGCPHTLEHVVFMGSQQYPYKGLLDKLGAKQLSATNAWTAQDHTCYTLETAGFEGFANLLPVYLDHILHATVKDSACLTEVYHVDAKGEEKGVVFSEMQGHEHNSENMMAAETKRLLYAVGSGYSTDTGGKLDALRTLEWSTIRDYHSNTYHAANLSVVVCGNVLPEELLDVLSPVEAALPDKSQKARPFVESSLSNAPSPLKHTVTSTVEFPDSSETAGELSIAWLGPPVRDTVNSTALQVIASYLSTEGSGKLNTKFVNVPEDRALASSVGTDLTDYLKGQFEIWFFGVPTEKLEEAGSTLLEYFESGLLEELDYSFLRQSIDRVYDTFVMTAEEDWDIFTDVAITEFVYGNSTDGKVFDEWFASTAEFDELRSWSEDDWRRFIRRWVAEPAKACVLGKPSKSVHKQVEKDKKHRLKTIQSTVDLANAERNLADAVAINERPIPNEMLNLFPTPDFGKIRFITSRSAATPKMIASTPKLHIDSEIQKTLGSCDVDLAIDFESTKSQFVTIKLYIAPQGVEKRLLPLIDVLLANVFAMPMMLEDGTVLSGEEVAQAIDSDLLDKSLGRDHELQEVVLFEVKAKADNYAKAVKWIERAMFQFVADDTHTSLFIAQHLKTLAADKRSESVLLRSSLTDTLLTDDSLRKRSDSLITEHQIREFASHIPETVKDVRTLANQLYLRENLRALVIADVPKLGDPLEPWKGLDSRLALSKNTLCQVPSCSMFLSSAGKEPSKKGVITLCAASESSNITVVAPGPSVYGHKDLPALALVNAYLEMTEGPFWTAVRGPGYAYGAFVRTSVQLGKIVLSISSAADVPGALQACRSVVEDIASEKVLVNEEGLTSGVSVIVSELASYLGQVPVAVKEKFMDTVMKGYEPEYVYKIMKEVQNVSVQDFIRVLRQYLLPLFDPASSMVFIVAPPSDQATLTETLQRSGYELEIREVEVEPDSDEEDDEEDEDDEESEEESDSDEEH